MKALIRLENGKYYASKVFAIMNDNLNDKYKAAYSFQYLVLNDSGDDLIIQNEYDQNSKHINTLLLIYDLDTSDMPLDKNGLGKVNFISDEELNDILNNNTTQDIINKCKEYITTYDNTYIEIKNTKDIDNLMSVAGGFHDGYIKNIEKNSIGELIILFDDLWGCNIEMIFSPDVIYKNNKNIEKEDAWWYESTMVFDDDSIIFVDEKYTPGNSLNDYDTWFKAKSIKYRIIPN